MKGKGRLPQYAVGLIVLIVFARIIFFSGLRLFVPEGRKDQTCTLMISKCLRLAQDIRPAVMLAVNNWRNCRKAIYRRSAL